MKSDYDRICEALAEEVRSTFMQVPAEILASLNNGEQMLESNDAMLSAVAGCLTEDIVAAPYKIRQTAERLVRFFGDAKTKGNGYFSGPEIVNDFKSKFKIKSNKAANSRLERRKSSARCSSEASSRCSLQNIEDALSN